MHIYVFTSVSVLDMHLQNSNIKFVASLKWTLQAYVSLVMNNHYLFL